MSVPAKHAVMLLITDDQGRFLFVKRNKTKPAGGYWCPMSGRLEKGETEEAAIVREALEELGIVVKPVEKVGQMPCSTGEYLLHWWRAEIISGRAHIAAPEEIDAICWVGPEALDVLEPHFAEDVAFIRQLSK